MNAKERLTAKIEGLETELLKETIVLLNDDFRNGTDIMIELCLNTLESRLPESEFIEFCNSLT